MSGRLIITGKKSYCPWRPENVERVLRDERLDLERRRREEEREGAARFEALKTRPGREDALSGRRAGVRDGGGGGRAGEGPPADGAAGAATATEIHVNLFAKEEREAALVAVEGALLGEGGKRANGRNGAVESAGVMPVFLGGEELRRRRGGEASMPFYLRRRGTGRCSSGTLFAVTADDSAAAADDEGTRMDSKLKNHMDPMRGFVSTSVPPPPPPTSTEAEYTGKTTVPAPRHSAAASVEVGSVASSESEEHRVRQSERGRRGGEDGEGRRRYRTRSRSRSGRRRSGRRRRRNRSQRSARKSGCDFDRRLRREGGGNDELERVTLPEEYEDSYSASTDLTDCSTSSSSSSSSSSRRDHGGRSRKRRRRRVDARRRERPRRRRNGGNDGGRDGDGRRRGGKQASGSSDLDAYVRTGGNGLYRGDCAESASASESGDDDDDDDDDDRKRTGRRRRRRSLERRTRRRRRVETSIDSPVHSTSCNCDGDDGNKRNDGVLAELRRRREEREARERAREAELLRRAEEGGRAGKGETRYAADDGEKLVRHYQDQYNPRLSRR